MIEIKSVQRDTETTLKDENSGLSELRDAQLALVGGGCGDVLWG